MLDENENQGMVPVSPSSEARNPAGGPDAGAGATLLPPTVPASAGAVPGDQVALGGGAFEGAALYSRELSSWQVGNGSADRDVFPAKNITDARAKDAARNDAYIDNGIEKYKDAVVGAKFILNASPNIDYLKRLDKRFDETWLEEFQTEVEAKYELAAESESRWFDAQRTKRATDIIRLGLASILIQGEMLASSEWIRRSRRPFKTAFLMIDPTRLDDPGVYSGRNTVNKNIRRGVRVNQYGEHVGYYIANEHPHDYYPAMSFNGQNYQYVPKETPWGRMNILHAFEEKRISQTRGISKMVSAMKEMRMTKSFREIMLQNAIVNATYAAAIESELPTEQVFEMLGGSDIDPKQFAQGIAGYTGGFLSSLAAYLKDSNGTMLNGVKIPHLFPGTKLNLLPAGQGGPLGTEFEKSLVRYMAANFNMSYEEFSGDMSGVNYSTLKGAVNETAKHMKTVKRTYAERIANFMYCNWLEEQIVNNLIDAMPRNAPAYWEDMNREAYSQAEWFGSGRGQIEELKESQAAGLRLKSKISTFEDEMAHLGKDWRRAIRQQAREKEFAKRYGIDLEFQDNSLNAASGSPRSKENPAGNKDKKADQKDTKK